MEDYGRLNTASLGVEYLVTNATTHSFIFGAMAELVDNARDAGADNLSIFKDESNGRTTLIFHDDGCGMAREEAEKVIVFGSSRKTDQEEPIGMYGNGLKSGSMRLGKDMILFTKKDEIITLLMISRTFYEQESVTQIKVPVPYFDANTRKQLGTDRKKNSLEMELIYKYSPYKTIEDLQEQFDTLAGVSGTRIVVYNLSTAPDGELELDFKSDQHDIQTAMLSRDDLDAGEELGDVEERRSFRAYTSILYKSPRMKIILRNRRVRTRHLAFSLYMPQRITVQYKNFKNQAEKQIADMKQQVESTKLSLTQVQGEVSNMTKLMNSLNKNQLAQLRKLQTKETDYKSQLETKTRIMNLRKQQSKKSDMLEFYFGLNINERYHDGMFFYNSDRLIKMYVKEGTMQAKEEITYRGIIAIVSVPKSALLPTHNKQDFNDAAEYKKLRKTVDQAMIQYWEEVILKSQKKSLSSLWTDFGYSNIWRKPPSDDRTYKERRARQTKHLQQCDKCLKWRVIPYHPNYLYKDFPDNWTCADSLDPSSNSCSKSQALPKIDSQPLDKSKIAASQTNVASSSKPGPASRKSVPSMKETLRQEREQSDKKGKGRKQELEAYKAQHRQKARSPSPELVSAKRKAPAPRAAPPQKVKAPIKTTVAQVAVRKSASAKPTPPPQKATPSRAAPRARYNLSSSDEDDAPPIRVMRRSSPARNTTPKQETAQRQPKPEPPTPKTSSTPIRSRQQSNSSTETPTTKPLQNGQANHLSDSQVKVEKSADKKQSEPVVNNTPAVKTPRYRFLTHDDLSDTLITKLVQARFQNKWQDATVMEVRKDSSAVFLKFANKMSLTCKVSSSSGVKGEVRIECSESEAEDTDNIEQPAPPVVNNTTAQPQTSKTAEIIIPAAPVIDYKHTEKLSELITILDVSGKLKKNDKINSITSTDIKYMVTKYTDKIKQEVKTDLEEVHSTEQKKIKQDQMKLRSELARVKEDHKQKMCESETKWKKREEDRFNDLKEHFTTVLRLCIGQGPESTFNTHEELVALLQTISQSLSGASAE